MPISDHPLPPPPRAIDAIVDAGPGKARAPRWIDAVFASVAVGIAAGAIIGFVVGGIGGRVAMRVLVLTSSDSVRGITSDDGFEIGRFSAATIVLLILTTMLGAVAGAVFGFLRMFVMGRTSMVAAGFGGTCASIGGAMLVQTHGIDFRFLGPLWLAVGLFVAIPGIWGAAMVIACERLTADDRLQAQLPARINEKRWGAVGWGLLVLLTVLGIVDLMDDVAALRR